MKTSKDFKGLSKRYHTIGRCNQNPHLWLINDSGEEEKRQLRPPKTRELVLGEVVIERNIEIQAKPITNIITKRGIIIEVWNFGKNFERDNIYEIKIEWSKKSKEMEIYDLRLFIPFRWKLDDKKERTIR